MCGGNCNSLARSEIYNLAQYGHFVKRIPFREIWLSIGIAIANGLKAHPNASPQEQQVTGKRKGDPSKNEASSCAKSSHVSVNAPRKKRSKTTIVTTGVSLLPAYWAANTNQLPAEARDNPLPADVQADQLPAEAPTQLDPPAFSTEGSSPSALKAQVSIEPTSGSTSLKLGTASGVMTPSYLTPSGVAPPSTSGTQASTSGEVASGSTHSSPSNLASGLFMATGFPILSTTSGGSTPNPISGMGPVLTAPVTCATQPSASGASTSVNHVAGSVPVSGYGNVNNMAAPMATSTFLPQHQFLAQLCGLQLMFPHQAPQLTAPQPAPAQVAPTIRCQPTSVVQNFPSEEELSVSDGDIGLEDRKGGIFKR